jgi:diacylglycerol O-acyltransferase / wax synthase
VGWLADLAALGPGFGTLARAFYVTQVQRTPRMYELFFAAMWWHRWYMEATRRGMGWWFGWRMQAAVEAFDPDVIISTYPLGSAGLSWLCRHRQLNIPAGAWVPAFCPRPSWLYRNLDITYVMHPCVVYMAVKADELLAAVRGEAD